ncbi:hypothetical protein [Paenibacillus harenae]|uniref:hypothetical protein n=1 Tax=Paenibacillus harenae TaxID=306543 RepID=UPI0004058C94|nr:hypothetical protein [Paenibacillus harenae]
MRKMKAQQGTELDTIRKNNENFVEKRGKILKALNMYKDLGQVQYIKSLFETEVPRVEQQ